MPNTPTDILPSILDDIPPLTSENFFKVLKTFLRLWLTENTLHRLYRWYVAMLEYISNSEKTYSLAVDEAVDETVDEIVDEIVAESDEVAMGNEMIG